VRAGWRGEYAKQQEVNMRNAHQQSLERCLLIMARIRNKARQCLITAAIGLAGVLCLMWTGRAGSQNRPQPPNHTISLTILRVKQIDNVDDTRGGELYAKVRMHGQSFPKTGHKEDRRDVSPNWTFITVAQENLTFWIDIDIYDEDWPDPDDHCDASPLNGWKTLRMNYNVATGTIGGGAITGSSGEVIHVRGARDSDRVEIWFRIQST
jgi:hypothetical protein